MKRLCVFCGSSEGERPVYVETARRLGRAMAEREIGLVFGGGKAGLMGTIADEVLAAGGEVIGIIPHGLRVREVAHERVTELRVVHSMHERKAMMAELSDGFLSMPGGMGTLEETCEMLTWAQLGIHRKPCGLLNVEGFYDTLLAFMDHIVAEGFLRPVYRGLVIQASEVDELLDLMARFEPPDIQSWIAPDET